MRVDYGRGNQPRAIHQPADGQLTRVTPSGTDHPHAAEPYSLDKCECDLACTLVVAVVRLEREVELYCVLRVGQDAAIHDGSGCR